MLIPGKIDDFIKALALQRLSSDGGISQGNTHLYGYDKGMKCLWSMEKGYLTLAKRTTKVAVRKIK